MIPEGKEVLLSENTSQSVTGADSPVAASMSLEDQNLLSPERLGKLMQGEGFSLTPGS